MEDKIIEFKIKEQLEKEREDIKSFDDLVAFLQRIKNNCNIDYGAAPRSIAQAALATAWYLADDFGITGFQASYVMWDFIKDWRYRNNECGMKIVNYDEMLYPQNYYNFEKAISKNAFIALQKKALKKLKEEDYALSSEIEHWKSIVDGNVPFGYILTD